MAYDREANVAFDCPGHQGGQFYRKSPAGQLFFKHFGESIFRNDLCNADVRLGDLLIHDGAAADAQRHAAQVFGSDKTYFVLNGTSTSNKVVTGAVLRRGDLVLFDRNNHKSLHQGALVQAGAIPVFLPTARNSFGMIGAVDWDAWDEAYLREQIRTNPLVTDPERHLQPRPFRLACIQLATYDGTVYNVRKVLREDRRAVRLRALGRSLDRLQRVPPAVRGPQPDARRRARSGNAGAVLHPVGPQTARRLLAGLADPQARRAHPRAAAVHRAQALQRIVPDARVHVALLSAVCVARRQRQSARGPRRRDAVGSLHRARQSRRARSSASSVTTTRETGTHAVRAVVLRSVRPRRRDDPRLARQSATWTDDPLGRHPHRDPQAASSSAGTSPPGAAGTGTPAMPTATRWWIRTSSRC